MVGLPYDCLANPLGAVRLTFEKAVASGSDPTTFGGKDWGAVDLFRDFVSDQSRLSQVPVLNAKNVRCLQSNTLVRFRGMIQDMLGNEFYAGVHKVGSTWKTNKYTDAIELPVGTSPDMTIWERRLLYCVPVPGQNSWADEQSDAAIIRTVDFKHQHGEKRRRVEEETDDMEIQISEGADGGSPGSKKMGKEGTLLRMEHGIGLDSSASWRKCYFYQFLAVTKSASCAEPVVERELGNHSESSQSQVSMIEESCFNTSTTPKFENDNLSCLIKVYDSTDSEIKLNEIFEFIGVFTFDHDIKLNNNEDKDLSDDLCEDVSAQLPPNKVPRLHCLIHRKLAMHDFIYNSPRMELKPHLVKPAREALLGHLSSVLGNDGLAAQFVLLNLLSKVHARVDSLAVGKLSLNLTSFNKESASVFGNQLKIAVENLLPFTHNLPLTVDYLNSTPLVPRKDYTTNRLITAALQVPEGSHFIIDETKLEAGILNAVGVNNTAVLKDLIETQKVEYDFQYYKMEMTADVQLLILSEGKSNILPSDVVLPFQPSSVSSLETVPREALEAWRWYLATARELPHSIEPEMQKVVENDLVTARQANKSLGSHDFSRLLTMGRLMSLSYGETCLSLEHWQMVKEMEHLRLERLS